MSEDRLASDGTSSFPARGEREPTHSLPSRPTRGGLAGAWNSDLLYSFRRSPVTMVAALLVVLCVGGSLLAPWIAPHNPFDLASIDLLEAFTRPSWLAGGKALCRAYSDTARKSHSKQRIAIRWS